MIYLLVMVIMFSLLEFFFPFRLIAVWYKRISPLVPKKSGLWPSEARPGSDGTIRVWLPPLGFVLRRHWCTCCIPCHREYQVSFCSCMLRWTTINVWNQSPITITFTHAYMCIYIYMCVCVVCNIYVNKSGDTRVVTCIEMLWMYVLSG